MSRIRITLVAGIAVLALAVAAPASAATTLTAVVGPSFTITLKKAGKKVSKLKAGTYRIVISDKSSIHNFHLTGPGVNKRTSVEKVGKATWTIKLRKGTYRYVCDPHAGSMKGSFKVG